MVVSEKVRGQDASLARGKPILDIKYNVANQPYRMQMYEKHLLNLTIFMNKLDLSKRLYLDKVVIRFEVNTLSPQFNILGFYGEENKAIVLNKGQIKNFQFYHNTQISLVAEYIGHVTIRPKVVEYYSTSRLMEVNNLIANDVAKDYKDDDNDDQKLHIVIVPPDSIWNLIFIISVSIFITITYINIGAQLDVENTLQLVRKPKTIILGLIITIFIMPIASWLAGQYFLSKQSLYRIGSFVFACGPAASASTLWTVMLDSDKELSVGLQVASTISAILAMPLLLYFMETAMIMQSGSHSDIKVPYTKLIQTLTILSIALWIGYKFVGQSKKAKQISSKIFRPLTFFVLFFIIIFSSIIYYYVYIMFDWTIVLTSFVITMITYIVSGLLGYLINGNLDHSIAISISSTYKNSGVAFAVLVVAFEAPDTYIAYVPCLTQVVTTSLTLYLFYSILKLINFIRRRNQPPAINAEIPVVSNESSSMAAPVDNNISKNSTIFHKVKEVRSDSIGDKSITRSNQEEEADSNELMNINVHDEVLGSPKNSLKDSIQEATTKQQPTGGEQETTTIDVGQNLEREVK